LSRRRFRRAGEGGRRRAGGGQGPGRRPRGPDLGGESARGRRSLRVHAAPGRGGAGARGAARVSRRASPRILVVDDEPTILQAVRTNLTRQGMRVDTAETGRQALVIYAQRRPDLILLDLGLPDMEGLEIIRAVRREAETPIVVLSARGMERDKV